MLKLFSVETYNDARKIPEVDISIEDITSIEKLIINDNYYHVKLYKDKIYKLFFDIDGIDIPINDFLDKITQFFNSSYGLNLTLKDFVYTENDAFINNDELPNYYHVVLPRYSCSLETMKQMRSEFIVNNKKFKNIYDSSVYKNNGYFRLPNQTKGVLFVKEKEKKKELSNKDNTIKDLKIKGIHRIKEPGNIMNFIFDYGIETTENIDSKVKKTIVKVDIEPINEGVVPFVQLKEDKNLSRLKSLLKRLENRNIYTPENFHESQWFTLLTLIKSAGGSWKCVHKLCQFLPNHSPCKCEHSFNGINNVVLDPLVQLEKIVLHHDELIHKAEFANKDRIDEIEKIYKFDFNENYCLTDFRKEFQDGRFDFDLIKKLHKICVFIVTHNAFCFKTEISIFQIDKIQQTLPRVINPKTEKYINWAQEIANIHSMGYTSTNYGSTIDYENNVFNMSIGYIAKQIDDPDQVAIDMILDLIMKVYANYNELLYEYFINYFAYLLQNAKKIDTCLILISDQGYGKTAFFKLMGLILGPDSSNTNLTQISRLGQGFNTYSEGNRLVVVNEIATSAADFRSTWETFKSLVTEDRETVEGKYVKGKQIVNTCDYVLVSNHEEAIIIEEEDRRFVVFECNDIYQVDNKNKDKYISDNNIEKMEKYERNLKYWGNFNDLMYTKRSINSIYTYLMNFNVTVNLRAIIMTPIKKRMVFRSLPSALRFLYHFAKSGHFDTYIKRNKISATELHCLYTTWAKNEYEAKIVSGTRFGTIISKKLDKFKNNTIFYNLSRLNDFTEFFD